MATAGYLNTISASPDGTTWTVVNGLNSATFSPKDDVLDQTARVRPTVGQPLGHRRHQLLAVLLAEGAGDGAHQRAPAERRVRVRRAAGCGACAARGIGTTTSSAGSSTGSTCATGRSIDGVVCRPVSSS